MKAPAALLTLIVLLAACGGRHGSTAAPTAMATPTPPPVLLTHWTNPAYPYEVGYPEGWKPAASNPDAVRFLGPAGRQIAVNVQAVPEHQPPISLPIYADQQVEALRRATPDLIELQRVRVGLPNKQAGIEVDVAWGSSGAPNRALLLYVIDGGVGYTLRADAPPDAFAAARRTLDAALRSFTLTPSE